MSAKFYIADKGFIRDSVGVQILSESWIYIGAMLAIPVAI
jgi:hypothetical protein